MSWFVPGRIEVLGTHTDYAGGRTLVCAVEQGVTTVCRPGERGIRIRSDAAAGDLVLSPGSDAGLPAGHWGHYVQTAIDRLARNFGPLPALDLALSSTLPLASGMSSSSAMLSGVALAVADAAGFTGTPRWRDAMPDAISAAGYLASIENGAGFRGLEGTPGVGTRGGSEDHAAMICGGEGELVELDFSPMCEVRHIALPADHTFVVAVSGVLAEKKGAARERYNAASAAVAEILRRANEASGRHDATLADAVATDAARARALVAGTSLQARLEHFLIESGELVPAAADALGRGDLASFGAASAESQRIAESLLCNQIPETTDLVRSALELGAPAARSFGAGFGGSVWALVPIADSVEFAARWWDDYAQRWGRPGASVLITSPGGAARRCEDGSTPWSASEVGSPDEGRLASIRP